MSISTITINNALRALERIDREGVRGDFRESARLASEVITKLHGQPSERRIRQIAIEIADKAAVRKQLVYRTKRTGSIRWQAADTWSIERIPTERVIGTYDEGADWRRIAADLRASA